MRKFFLTTLALSAVLTGIILLTGCPSPATSLNPDTNYYLTLNKSSITIEQGVSELLVATVLPEDANTDVTWLSSNDAIATVDKNGLVLGLSSGSAQITVTTQDGKHSAVCDVTVKANLLSLVYMDIKDKSIKNVSPGMEYSLDGKKTWVKCTDFLRDIDFKTGDLVWVRYIDNSSSEFFLGRVNATTGPDLTAVGRINFQINSMDVTFASPGDTGVIVLRFSNIGDTSAANSDLHI